MFWIDMEQLLEYHAEILKESGGEDGVRDKNSLEAALAAPLQTLRENGCLTSLLPSPTKGPLNRTC